MKQSIRGAEFAALAALLLSLLFCPACGPGKRPIGSVSGKVTYKGKPLTSGMVLFVNHETGTGANADLDAAGTYKIPLLETGEYKVAVMPPRTPSLGELESGVPMPKPSVDLPREITNPQTSGLTATVEEGENTADFDL